MDRTLSVSHHKDDGTYPSFHRIFSLSSQKESPLPCTYTVLTEKWKMIINNKKDCLINYIIIINHHHHYHKNNRDTVFVSVVDSGTLHIPDYIHTDHPRNRFVR